MFFLLFLIGAVTAEQCNVICHRNWEPVCGSDGQTYGNACELASDSCVKRNGVVKLYGGECVPTKTAQFTHCPQMCNLNHDPVCGSDGVTYGNECEMTSTACLKRKVVAKAYKGTCRKPCQMACPMNYDPVCGSDGRTYDNECELQGTACFKRRAISIRRRGRC